jgi:thiosulfate reductase cytochrome b subunit
LKTKRLFLHPPLERLWHAAHTLGFLVLGLSGAHIHWPESFPLVSGLETAMLVHNVFGVWLVVDFSLWIPYLVLSRRYTHYVPLSRDMPAGMMKQALYYGRDIFFGGHHPFEVSEKQKFNPMQKWAYIGVMFGMMPPLMITGVIMLLPAVFRGPLEPIGGIRAVAVIHTALAFAGAAFLASHLYLATTGHTPLDAFRSMVTGWAVEAVHDDHQKPGHGKGD